MITKGIRGAITVEENTAEAIKAGTLKLLDEIVEKNNIEKSMVSHVIFTLTKDLTAAFPAKFARLDRNWTDVAMLCFNEATVDGAIEKCIRILLVVNCEEYFVPQYVYLKGASKLRSN